MALEADGCTDVMGSRFAREDAVRHPPRKRAINRSAGTDSIELQPDISFRALRRRRSPAKDRALGMGNKGPGVTIQE